MGWLYGSLHELLLLVYAAYICGVAIKEMKLDIENYKTLDQTRQDYALHKHLI